MYLISVLYSVQSIFGSEVFWRIDPVGGGGEREREREVSGCGKGYHQELIPHLDTEKETAGLTPMKSQVSPDSLPFCSYMLSYYYVVLLA